jgi:PKD repeat protein
MRYLTSLLLLLPMLATIISCEKSPEERPPSANFTISPAIGTVSTIFEFDGNSSTDDNDSRDSLKVRWDFDGDGAWDTQLVTDKISYWQYDSPDLYTVTMEVVNTKGWSDIETMDLTVMYDSVPPTAIFSADPDTASVNTVFCFSAGASSDPYTPTHELEFRWDWQSDGIWDTPYINDTVRCYKYTLEGTYRVLMEVKNDVMLTDTTSRLIQVYAY